MCVVEQEFDTRHTHAPFTSPMPHERPGSPCFCHHRRPASAMLPSQRASSVGFARPGMGPFYPGAVFAIWFSRSAKGWKAAEDR